MTKKAEKADDKEPAITKVDLEKDKILKDSSTKKAPPTKPTTIKTTIEEPTSKEAVMEMKKETKKKTAIEKLELIRSDDDDDLEEFPTRSKNKIDPSLPSIVSLKAYRRMVIYGLRYANFDLKSKDWREVYGILVGNVGEDGVCHVIDAIPMIVGDRAGVVYETKTYVDMAQIDQSIYERAVNDETGQFICGWWHTHPGFGFFFSEVDTYTQLGYQIPNPYAVGLVFDHTEKTEYFPGLEGLRLDDPNRGVLAEYVNSELKFDRPFEEIKENIDIAVEAILPRFSEITTALDHIHEVLRKKKMAQIQRNYGLILVPRSEKKITDDEELAEEEEDKYLYEWDPDFYKKKYRVPKFRETIENKITKATQRLEKITKTKKSKKFDPAKKLEETKNKIREEIMEMLQKPKAWIEKLKDMFSERIIIIDPYYDYLDTDERKIIEYLSERVNEYEKELENIEDKIKFRTIQVPEEKKEDIK